MKKKEPSRKTGKKSAKSGKIEQWFPAGWDDKRVRKVLEHYENQTEKERAAEIETAQMAADHTLIAIPNALVPAVRKLIARHGRSA